MPIKKCKYCKTRMNKVVWGMTSQHDYETADDFTEFRGCVITSPTESWRCDFCDSKIIPSHTPNSGICIAEAPREIREALDVFAARLNSISGYLPGNRHPDRGEPASLTCTGPNSELSVFSIEEHAMRGDYLKVRICNNLELQFFLNGTGQIFVKWASFAGFGKFCETQMQLSDPVLYDLETRLGDLLTGQETIQSVLSEIPKHLTECTGYECDHEEEFLWGTIGNNEKKMRPKGAKMEDNRGQPSSQDKETV